MPLAAPHLAVVPLQNVGWDYSDGVLLGFAVVLPRRLALDERTPVLETLAAFAGLDKSEPQAVVQLTRKHAWQVRRYASQARPSLRPDRWCMTATSWASSTPVLLDRFPDHHDPSEEAGIIAAACRNIGLPEPVEVELHKHSALPGAETCYPARGRRERSDWGFPVQAKFACRVRRHVALHFAEPVTGPVILGAGRFSGFGLCLPLE
jgi:CRISPR-associated protein Csb2